jgi:heat shock protein HslJ
MSQSPDPELPSNVQLENTYWKLVELEGEQVMVLPNHREAHLVLVPAEHSVRGSGGCNQLKGSYETKGDRLSFNLLATTRKMCAGILMKQEQTFRESLKNATHYRIDGEPMGLFAGERLLVRFEAVYF